MRDFCSKFIPILSGIIVGVGTYNACVNEDTAIRWIFVQIIGFVLIYIYIKNRKPLEDIKVLVKNNQDSDNEEIRILCDLYTEKQRVKEAKELKFRRAKLSLDYSNQKDMKEQFLEVVKCNQDVRKADSEVQKVEAKLRKKINKEGKKIHE